MKLVIYSMDDLAGSNIAKLIVGRYGFTNSGRNFNGQVIYKKHDVLLFGTQTSVRDLQSLPYNPEVCIVASRHKSESGKPTLTCHPTGNFGRAELGGHEGRLQMTNAHYMRQSLLHLMAKNTQHNRGYDVSLEVTHHGPTDLPFPLMYIEVGSTRDNWSDEDACTTVAETIHEMLFNGVEAKPTAIGFGGPHYAPNFNEVTENIALGHIMPKYSIEYLTKTMIQQMIEKTKPKPEKAIIDWKGLKGQDRENLTQILDELGLKWVKTSELK